MKIHLRAYAQHPPVKETKTRCSRVVPWGFIFFVIFGLIGVPCLMHGIKSLKELYKKG